jgi:alpha-N-arabinofuranosidase
MTNANGLFQQTIYYPYSWALHYAHGSVINLLVQSPTYEVSGMGQVPYLDAVATLSEDGKTSLFVLNRDLAKQHTVELNWQDKSPGQVLTSLVLTGDDLKASNSFDAPQRVVPQTMAKPATNNGRTKFEVPPRSYTIIQWGA